MASAFTRTKESRYTAQATAGTAMLENVFRAPFAGTFTGYIVPDTVYTGAATNHRTERFVNRGQAGSGTTVMGTKTFSSGVNAAAADETVITAVATEADYTVAEGDIIAFESVVVGSGMVRPAGLVVGYFVATN